VVGLNRVFPFKGWLPCEQLERKNPYTPDVNAVVIVPSLHDFWGHVIQGPTKSVPHFVRGVDGPPEVRQLENSLKNQPKITK
jgi:hypothetical protein